MWVDANLQARRRKRLEARRSSARINNRNVITAEQAEQEYRQAGFRILNTLDLLPGISMWRFYILEKQPVTSQP